MCSKWLVTVSEYTNSYRMCTNSYLGAAVPLESDVEVELPAQGKVRVRVRSRARLGLGLGLPAQGKTQTCEQQTGLGSLCSSGVRGLSGLPPYARRRQVRPG